MEEEKLNIKSSDGVVLRAILARPATPSSPNASLDGVAVVMCHPHPFIGGGMHNPLMVNVSRRLAAAGTTTLRFDFRGVGASTGKRTWMRQGEQDDVLACARYLTRLQGVDPTRVYVTGYSFGASVALGALDQERSDHVAGFVGISYPFGVKAMLIPGGGKCRSEKPKLFLVASGDVMCKDGEKGAEAEIATLPKPTETVRVDTGHGWSGRHAAVARIILEWLESVRGGGGGGGGGKGSNEGYSSEGSTPGGSRNNSAKSLKLRAGGSGNLRSESKRSVLSEGSGDKSSDTPGDSPPSGRASSNGGSQRESFASASRASAGDGRRATGGAFRQDTPHARIFGNLSPLNSRSSSFSNLSDLDERGNGDDGGERRNSKDSPPLGRNSVAFSERLERPSSTGGGMKHVPSKSILKKQSSFRSLSGLPQSSLDGSSSPQGAPSSDVDGGSPSILRLFGNNKTGNHQLFRRAAHAVLVANRFKAAGEKRVSWANKTAEGAPITNDRSGKPTRRRFRSAATAVIASNRFDHVGHHDGRYESRGSFARRVGQQEQQGPGPALGGVASKYRAQSHPGGANGSPHASMLSLNELGHGGSDGGSDESRRSSRHSTPSPGARAEGGRERVAPRRFKSAGNLVVAANRFSAAPKTRTSRMEVRTADSGFGRDSVARDDRYR